MTIREILEEHLRVKGYRGVETLCICGWHTAQPLRPEDLHRAHVAEVLDKHMQEREAALLSEVADEARAAAQPVVNSAEELVTTRTGLALANAAFNEGLSAGIKACNDAESDCPWNKPVSPYSAPLLAMIKADRPEVQDV